MKTLREVRNCVHQYVTVHGPATVVQQGSFTFVGVEVYFGGETITSYGFSKCDRHVDEFSSERGVEIALKRAEREAAKIIWQKITEMEKAGT